MFDLAAMGLETANPGASPTGLDLDLLADLQRAVDERPGDDRSKAADREHAIDR